MWSIAEERVATATGRADGEAPDDAVTPYWSEVVATNAPTVRSGDPNVIYAGEHLRLPRVTGNGQATADTPVVSPPTPASAGADPSPAPADAGSSGPTTAPPTSAAVPTTAAPTTAPPTRAATSAEPSSALRPSVAPAPPVTNGTVPTLPGRVSSGQSVDRG
jgi:hypothetical protein